ncbi:MAG: uracil-DNA glycosylase family protein [Pseudomonadota bacterium]
MSDEPDIWAAMLSALAWQIDLGADEAIAEAPVDRFKASAPPAQPPVPTPDAAREPGGAASAAPDARPGSGASPTNWSGSGASPTNSTGSGTSRTDAPAPGDGRTDLTGPGASPATVPSSGAPTKDTSTDTPAHLAASARTLQDLAEVMRAWGGSPLKETARNFVFSDGLPGARLMVIGEAPGADEDRLGKPFVGRAGQLLDKMLAAIGIARTNSAKEDAAYIANILPWRPPGNRTPTEAEAQMFLPFMARHIELARPEIIFAVGNTSVKALLDTKTGIKRLRGTWMRHGPTGVPVLPSFHPAYLLRQPADKRLAWRDLLSLRDVLDGAAPPL